jgi:predicted  nucleic acid-binding Zn-ribbon protein
MPSSPPHYHAHYHFHLPQREARRRRDDEINLGSANQTDLVNRVLDLEQENRSLKLELREKEKEIMVAVTQKQRAELASKRAVLEQLQPMEKKDFRGRVQELLGENTDLVQKNSGLKARIQRLTQQLREAQKTVTETKEKHRRDVYARRMRHEVERDELKKRLGAQEVMQANGAPRGGLGGQTLTPTELLKDNNALRVQVQALQTALQVAKRHVSSDHPNHHDTATHVEQLGRDDETWPLAELTVGRDVLLVDAHGMLLEPKGAWVVPVGSVNRTPAAFAQRLEAVAAAAWAVHEANQGPEGDAKPSLDGDQCTKLVESLPGVLPGEAAALRAMLLSSAPGSSSTNPLVPATVVGGFMRVLANVYRSVASDEKRLDPVLAKAGAVVQANREALRATFDHAGFLGAAQVLENIKIQSAAGGKGLVWTREEELALLACLTRWMGRARGPGADALTLADVCRAVGAARLDVTKSSPQELDALRRDKSRLVEQCADLEMRLRECESHRGGVSAGGDHPMTSSHRGGPAGGAGRESREGRFPPTAAAASSPYKQPGVGAGMHEGTTWGVEHHHPGPGPGPGGRGGYAPTYAAPATPSASDALVRRAQLDVEETRREVSALQRALEGKDADLATLRSEMASMTDYKSRCLRVEADLRETESRLRDLRDKAMAAPQQASAEVEKVIIQLRDAQTQNKNLRSEVTALKRQVQELTMAVAAGSGSTQSAPQSNGPNTEDRLRAGAAHEAQAARNEAQLLRLELRRREVELEAVHDKLAVYLQYDHRGAGRGETGRAMGPRGGVSDHEKTADELVAEVEALRDEISELSAELRKANTLLSTRADELQAMKDHVVRLESMQARTLHEAKAERGVWSQRLEVRDEAIRRLALRGGRLDESSLDPEGHGLHGRRISEAGSDMSALTVNENIIEMVVCDASLEADVVPTDFASFLTVDFYVHGTVVSNVGVGHQPQYGSTFQFVVDQDASLLEYLSTNPVRVDLNSPDGLAFNTMGKGVLSLSKLATALVRGSGTVPIACYVDVYGEHRRVVGRARITVRALKPLPVPLADSFLAQQREASKAREDAEHAANLEKRGETTAASASATTTKSLTTAHDLSPFVRLAREDPTRAAAVRFGAVYASDLKPAGSATACLPHVGYTFPGLPGGTLFSAAGRGTSPVFQDDQEVSLVRAAKVDSALRDVPLFVDVFDDAQIGEAAIIGRATVSLASLVEGGGVDGVFEVVHPRTREKKGTVAVFAKWADPMIPSPPKTREAGEEREA